MELQRNKIIRIADKFVDEEFQYLDQIVLRYIKKLTVIWGAKEDFLKSETKRIVLKIIFAWKFENTSKKN
jgi:hypothetical protein